MKLAERVAEWRGWLVSPEGARESSVLMFILLWMGVNKLYNDYFQDNSQTLGDKCKFIKYIEDNASGYDGLDCILANFKECALNKSKPRRMVVNLGSKNQEGVEFTSPSLSQCAAAIYAVRCNLIHGDKTKNGPEYGLGPENEKLIDWAYQSLSSLVGYIERDGS